MLEIIQDFIKKLSKKLEITLYHTKQENFKYKQFSRIIIQSNLLWKNKKNLQNIRRSKKTNKIK